MAYRGHFPVGEGAIWEDRWTYLTHAERIMGTLVKSHRFDGCSNGERHGH